MPTNTSFSGINQQLNFQNTAPIAINDVLVRALTGLPQDILPSSPISFSDLSGKNGVGPIVGPTVNSQASYFTTNSSVNLQFLTDVYQANVVWSSNLIAGDSVVFNSSGANASVLLQRTTVGGSSANIGVTATLYYGNTLIGSNTVYVSLQANVYNSNLTFSSTPSGFVSFANGYSAQTATLSITAQANVPGGIVNWNISPNNVGALLINGNTVTLTAISSRPGISNSTSYQVSATITSNGQPVIGAGGGIIANVSAFMYSSDFIFNPSSNIAVVANTGPLTLSAPFSVSGNAPGSVITWSSNVISGSTPVFAVASGNLNANLSLVVANNSSYGGANSIVTVTANMYSDASLTTLIASHSANVSLQGLVYGMNYSPPPTTNTQGGFSAQTASIAASATYQFGTFDWSYTAISGVASVVKTNGSAGNASANISFTDTASVVGSNSSSWSVAPTISYGSLLVTGPSTNLSLNATVFSSILTLSGPTTNTQYANNGPLNSSVTLSVSNITPPGTNVIWSAAQVSGANASLTVANNNQSSTLTLSLDANTFTFANAVYNITANCYNTSTNVSVSSNTQQVTLVAGTYGLNINSVPVASNTQSGYTAQTASATVSASVLAGQFGWQYSNTSGISPSFSTTGLLGSNTGYYTSGSGTWSQNTSSVGTNTVTEQWQIAVFAPNTTINPIFVSSAQTFSLTAQQNAYSFTLPSATTNTQLLGSTSSNLTITTLPTCNISGYTLSGWNCSNTTVGYSFSSNTTAAVVGFSTTLTSGSPVAYYTTTISGNLLDGSGRQVQTFSYPVVLRSYYPNPIINSSNSAVSGYTAQTASGTYSLSLWNGATTVSASVSNTGDAPVLTNGVQNTSYWSMNYSLGTGSVYQGVSGTITFQPAITFYDQSTTLASLTVSLSANNYDPAPTVTGANSTVHGWIPPQTAYAIETASCNSSIAAPVWSWGSLQTTSGGFTGSYLQGSGNNQYVVYNQTSNPGSSSGSGYPASATLSVNGTVVSSVTPGIVYASSALYNPALVISGPSSNTQSAPFTSSASLTLSASANSSIPNVSYQVSASPVSGSASVSYGSGNQSCTLTVNASAATVSATYNVTFSVLSGGNVIQTKTQQVSLSATGTVPNYTLTTPGNASAAGFNFAQTCSSTCYLNGLTGSGDYAIWYMYNVSGTTPAWSTPGGSNGYITTTQTCSSVGSVPGTIYQVCKVYSPSGSLVKTLTSSNYSLTSTVYNPALTVNVANAAVSGNAPLTATSTVSLGSNSTGGSYQLSITKSSGATGSVSINSGNTGGSLSLTSSTTANAVYSYSASILLNGQTIAGPITGTMYSAVTITYTPVSATVNSTNASGSSSGTNLKGSAVTSPPTVATASGGSGSYSYSWTVTTTSTDGSNITVGYPTSSSTNFAASNMTGATGTAVCTVSDGTSSANTPVVDISLSYISNK